jgi:adenosylhomocysteine nucleosidase
MVAAMEREVLPLVKRWRTRAKQYAGRNYTFFEHGDTVLVCGGIGPDAARRAAEALIALYTPSIVYSVGFAGALDAQLRVGDIVHPGRVVNAGDCSSVEIAAGNGVLVSFSSVASPAQKTKLREAFAAQVVDMEAAAVARAAQARGVAFAAVKAVSDQADFDFPLSDRFVDSAGQFQAGRFMLFAVVRPWLWLKIAQLASHSNRAARALCDELRKIELEKTIAHLESPNRASTLEVADRR